MYHFVSRIGRKILLVTSRDHEGSSTKDTISGIMPSPRGQKKRRLELLLCSILYHVNLIVHMINNPHTVSLDPLRTQLVHGTTIDTEDAHL